MELVKEVNHILSWELRSPYPLDTTKAAFHSLLVHSVPKCNSFCGPEWCAVSFPPGYEFIKIPIRSYAKYHKVIKYLKLLLHSLMGTSVYKSLIIFKTFLLGCVCLCVLYTDITYVCRYIYIMCAYLYMNLVLYTNDVTLCTFLYILLLSPLKNITRHISTWIHHSSKLCNILSHEMS